MAPHSVPYNVFQHLNDTKQCIHLKRMFLLQKFSSILYYNIIVGFYIASVGPNEYNKIYIPRYQNILISVFG